MSLLAVFQIGSLGDSIVSVPALLSARKLLPECSEYILISTLNPGARVVPSQVFDMVWKPKSNIGYYGPQSSRVAQLSSVAAAIAQIRSLRPKHCLYLMPSDRTQAQIRRDELFFRVAGVKELIGFHEVAPSGSADPNTPSKEITEAFLRYRRLWGSAAPESFPDFAAAPFLKPGAEAAETVAAWLRGVRKHPERPLVAICPYTSCSSKDIPEPTLREVISLLTGAGAEIVVVGSAKDSAAAETLIARSGTGINACGKFSVAESAALLALCPTALCADTGPMHLAAAMGVPCVIVFSRKAKTVGRWFPLGGNHAIFYRDVSCAGCELEVCPVPGHPCMQGITAAQVFAALQARLRGDSTLLPQYGDPRCLQWELK